MIRHLCLVGMPGAGKSTVGPLVADRLGLPFVDLDAVIAAAHGPVPGLFARRGEAAFRALEREALTGLLAGPPAVIALGGGAFADPETAAIARQGSRTVWLDVGLATLAARVGDGEGRPLLAEPGTLARLHAARAPAYARACARVDAGAPPDAVVAAVVRAARPAPDAVERVPVGVPGYEALAGPGLLDRAGDELRRVWSGARAVIVTDSHVGPLYAPRLAASLTRAGIAAETITVPPGEASKSWESLARLVDALAAARLTRGDLVIALGGGVVGDLAGFAAAVYMRGIAWALVPTTLLSQADSSVGGKTAIDIAAGKNLAGAFHDPVLVLADTDTLVSLPDRELRSGYAEIVKYGFIDHPRLFDWLDGGGGAAALLPRDPAALRLAVAESVRAKARIVSEDPREAGRRALLNLGHTFGHAIEAETGFGAGATHGEAVAIGTAMAFRFSAAEGLCRAEDAARVGAHLEGAGLPVRLREAGAFAADALLARMRGDKKAGAGGLTLILARGIGGAFAAHGVDEAALRRFLIAEGAAG